MSHILQCHKIMKIDFVRGQGCYLYDAQGKRYIDLESGIWAAVLGYCHPRINKVMEAQIKKVMHLGTYYPSPLAESAAMDILDIVGIEDGKCVFLSSGSEAVEFGVQAVRRITGKQLLLTFTSSYLAAYGSAGRKSADEWYLLNWDACTNDYLKGIPFENIGGFVFEPGGSGSGFVRFPPKGLVQEIAQRIKQTGGLLIANEITTGMGRTGKWFGFQHYDFQPDIVSIGKGLGNGYPVSAIAMKRHVAEELEDSGLCYAQSHQNDPLGCAIAREVIAALREEKWIERGDAMGSYFLEGLKQFEGKYNIVKEARGRGMLLALEFHPHEKFSAETAQHALLQRGFLAGYSPVGNILRFDPSLITSKDDILLLLENLDHILKEV